MRHRSDVTCERVEAVLGRDHLVPLRLQGRISLLKDKPSAQMPWTNTMLGLLCLDMFRSFDQNVHNHFVFCNRG